MSLEQPLSVLPTVQSAQPSDSDLQTDTTSVSLMSINVVAEYCESLSSEPSKADDQDSAPITEAPPAASRTESEPEGDQQLIEALRSPKDRLFVLKLGESIERLIQDRHIRNRYETTPASSYHRLLVHRAAAYYKVAPEAIENEHGAKTISLTVVTESRIPTRRLADLVPADEAPLRPIMIMKRPGGTPSKPSSIAGSGNDESAPGTGEVSDEGPSEGGSSSRGSKKKPLTMSERQALYEEARSRIFKDLEEKDKKTDMSASSSTLSLMSAGSSSADAGGCGGSSIGESLDDTGSVDRDWTKGNKDKRDGTRRASSVASNNTSRSYSRQWSNHGHSPSFGPRTLYDPSAPSTPSSNSSTSSPYPTPYQPAVYHPVYPYGGGPYMPYPPFGYYPYGAPPPPHAPAPPQHPGEPSGVPNTDNSTSSPVESYPNGQYSGPYVWQPPPPGPIPPEYPPPVSYPHPHAPVHAYTYPGAVSPFGPQMHPPPLPPHPAPQSPPQLPQQPQQHPQSPPLGTLPNRAFGLEPVPDTWNRPVMSMGYNQGQLNGGMNPLAPMFRMNGPGNVNANVNNNNRGMPGHPRNAGHQKRNTLRPGYSYGPGVGGPNMGETTNQQRPGGSGGIARRANSNGSGNNNGLETASVASSSTSSSSSVQTFTSASSAHPSLPPRPDWAVGLKPDPTLHQSSSSRHQHQQRQYQHQQQPSTMNGRPHVVPVQQQRIPHPGAMPANGSQPQRVPPNPNEFPPLSVAPNPGDKRPALGAWATGPTRSILAGPGPSTSRPPPNGGPANGPSFPLNVGTDASRLDEHDAAFERPGPKTGATLFNPNSGSGAKSPNGKGSGAASGAGTPSSEKEKSMGNNARGEAVANAILADRVAALKIEQQDGEGGQATKHLD